jgi:hypothetical protein
MRAALTTGQGANTIPWLAYRSLLVHVLDIHGRTTEAGSLLSTQDMTLVATKQQSPILSTRVFLWFQNH